jgi:hypothetical protein
MDGIETDIVLLFFELHGHDDQSPLMALYITNGILYVKASDNSVRHTYGPVPTGRRVPIEVVHHAPKAGPTSNGFVRIYLDGELVHQATGQVNRPQNQYAGYWKMGLYDYWDSLDHSGIAETSIYMDDLRLYVQP